MKRLLSILIAIMCLFPLFLTGCGDNAGGGIKCETGEIVRFAPFGDDGVTSVVGGDDKAVMINSAEAWVFGSGDFTLEARSGSGALQTAVFTASAAKGQIASQDIVFYIGESMIPSAIKLPSGDKTDCDFTVLSGDGITADGNMITAVKEGESELLVRDKTGSRAVKVKVTTLKHFLGMSLGITEIVVGSTKTLDPVFSDGKNRQVEFAAESGADVISISGNSVTAVKEGVAVLKAHTEGEDYRFAISSVTAQNQKPTVTVDDMRIAVSESAVLKPVTNNAGENPRFEYTVLSGENIIKIENGILTALKTGSARVRCNLFGTEACDEFSVEVHSGNYKVAVDNVTVTAGRTVIPEPVLLPEREGTVFTYEIISGGDFAEVQNNALLGIKTGQAVVRCHAVGLSVFADFSLLVKSAVSPVPDGYVRISDYLYASVAPGCYKTEREVDIFTPLTGAAVYYTTDSSPVKPDLSNAAVWTAPKMLKAGKGHISDYKLTQQVDAALTWAGGGKDYSAAYVDNVQNGGKYPLVSLASVFNFAVVYDGKIVDKNVSSYIITGHDDFADVPVISLSAPEEMWFDGIPGGRGTSVYNNVYVPGSNMATDYAGRANLEFFEPDGSGFSVNTQVKVGGGWSRGRPQRTLHLNFNKDENGKKQTPVNFEIFGDRTKRGDDSEILDVFTRFRLWNGGSRYDSAMRFNDAFLQLVAEDLNVATAGVRPVIVYLNGEFWGFYYLREHYADVYFQYNYDVDKDDVQYFDYVGGNYVVSDGDEQEAGAFIDEMNAFLSNPEKNFGDDAVFNEFFSKYVDEESMTDYIIMQTWCGNWDGIGNRNNHRLWRVRTEEAGNQYTDGKLRFVLHDLDMGMLGDDTLNGQYKNLLSLNSPFSVAFYNIFNRALSNEGYRFRLYSRAEQLMKGALGFENTSAVLDKLAASVRNLIDYNVARWLQAQNRSQWENALNYGYNWLRRRNDIYLSAIRETLAIYEDEYVPLTGEGIVFGEKEIRINQYYAGNGSIAGGGRFELRNLSLDNFEITYTLVNNGLKDGGGQFHAKFIYGSAGNNNYVTRILKNGRESVIFTDVKSSGKTYEYRGALNLYEGVHKLKYVKKGTVLSVYIDDVKAYDAVVPADALIGIDLYQHTANAVYKNFIVRKL